MDEVLDEPTFSLATTPPTSGQRRLMFAVAAVMLTACGALVPFAAIQMPWVNPFIPTLEAIFFVTDLITAILLFSHFLITRSRALLVLANGYLFTALIVIPHALTFPGAFSPTGLFGAGLQSTAWLYIFWHLGFPSALLIYTWLKDEIDVNFAPRFSTLSVIGMSTTIIIGLVCGLAWIATAGDRFLPDLFLDRARYSSLVHYVVALMLLISAIALALLWIRRRSVLDQWLLVVAGALIAELVFTALLSPSRFSLGWYAGRGFSLVAATVVLAVLLGQTTRLYANLARSNMALQRERQNKLMSLEALAASISHEVRQPLAAIAMQGGAGLRFLDHTPPNLEEVRSAFNAMVRDGHRASQVIGGIRNLFTGADQGQEPIDVNEIALGALRILRGELKDHGITTRVELTPDLPHVMGHSGQLQEVILNLVHNAVEAMDTIRDRGRVLRVITQRRDRDTIIVAVEDTGPGIPAEKLGHIFDAFATTKRKGMGLGLAISRMIVEHHGGRLSVDSDEKRRGARFHFTLPINSAAGSTAAPL